jgi:hypothetical protein
MPSFNVYDFIEEAKAKWRNKELSLEETLELYERELRVLKDLWSSPSTVAGSHPIQSYFRVERSRRGLFVFGNGKRFKLKRIPMAILTRPFFASVSNGSIRLLSSSWSHTSGL